MERFSLVAFRSGMEGSYQPGTGKVCLLGTEEGLCRSGFGS